MFISVFIHWTDNSTVLRATYCSRSWGHIRECNGRKGLILWRLRSLGGEVINFKKSWTEDTYYPFVPPVQMPVEKNICRTGHWITVSESQLALFGDELASASGSLKECGVLFCTEPAFLKNIVAEGWVWGGYLCNWGNMWNFSWKRGKPKDCVCSLTYVLNLLYKISSSPQIKGVCWVKKGSLLPILLALCSPQRSGVGRPMLKACVVGVM